MQKLVSLTIVLCCLYLSSWSQNVLSGVVVDEDHTPVPFANVLLLNEADTSLCSGAITDEDGRFVLDHSCDPVYLMISAVGYVPATLSLEAVSMENPIVLKTEELEELKVVQQTAIFSKERGDLVVNVSNTMLGNSSSVQEIISKSPGLSVGAEGIEVVGKGSALIFMDGQRSTWDALKAIPVSQIKSIKVMKNPEAAYDADGMAVVVVELVDLGLEGIKGSVTANYTKGFYHLGYLDASLSYHKGRLTINAGVNNNIGATGGRSLRTFDIKSVNPDYEATNHYKEKVYLRNVPNWLAGVKYQIDPKKTVSVQYNGSYADYDLDVNNELNRTYQQEDSSNQIQSHDQAMTIDYLHSFSANYRQKLDSLGSSLFIGGTYNVKSSRYHDTISEVFSVAEEVDQMSQTLSKGNTLNYVRGGLIDWKKVGKKGAHLKAGVKFAASLSNSSVFIQNGIQGGSIQILDDHYVYKEELSAAYLSYFKIIKKGDFNLGLRSECTNNNAKINDNVYLDSAYLSFFPNARLHLVFDKLEYISSFSSRIQRPSFADITPYTYYINSFSRVTGNSKILPSMVYTLENKWIYKNLDGSVGLIYTQKPRVFVALSGEEDGSITFKAVNMKEMYSAYLELGHSFNLGIWSASNVVNLSIAKYFDDQIDISQVQTSPRLYLYSYHQLKVADGLKLEVIGRFTNSHKNGRVENFASGSLDLSVSKSFEKGNWNLQVGVYDIFRTDRRIQNSWMGEDQNFVRFTGDTRYLRVSVSKSFGKLKQVNYDHNNVGEGELNRAY